MQLSVLRILNLFYGFRFRNVLLWLVNLRLRLEIDNLYFPNDPFGFGIKKMRFPIHLFGFRIVNFGLAKPSASINKLTTSIRNLNASIYDSPTSIRTPIASTNYLSTSIPNLYASIKNQTVTIFLIEIRLLGCELILAHLFVLHLPFWYG
jgi:hypothetical protein